MARKYGPSKIYYMNTEFLSRGWHVGPFSLGQTLSFRDERHHSNYPGHAHHFTDVKITA